MSSTQRLQAVQAKLEERGFNDVKFFLKPEVAGAALSDVEDDLANLLTDFLDGKYKVSTFDDRALLAEPQPA